MSTEEGVPVMEAAGEEAKDSTPDVYKDGVELTLAASASPPRRARPQQLPWRQAIASETFSVPVPDAKHFMTFR